MKQETSFFSFTHYQLNMGIIISQIENENWRPDVIIGIARGGCILGVHLSHIFNTQYETINLSYRDGKVPTVSYDDWPMNRVLVVDDIVDSGVTMSKLMADAPQNVKTAALIYNVRQSFKPDFYGMLIDRKHEKEWFEFWWEK